MSALVHAPVFGLALTLTAYLLASALHQRLGRPALLAPVLVTMIIVAAALQVLHIPYPDYLRSVATLTLLLGPATVALALPLLRARAALVNALPAVLVALVVTGVVSLGTTVLVLKAFGVPRGVLRAALPRSVTTPVALGLAQTLHASVSLVVVLTLISGILGAITAPALLTLARVTDPRARGFAIGMCSHGIGTARALAESEDTGGWSSAGMVLNALSMTLAIPLVAHLFVP